MTDVATCYQSLNMGSTLWQDQDMYIRLSDEVELMSRNRRAKFNSIIQANEALIEDVPWSPSTTSTLHDAPSSTASSSKASTQYQPSSQQLSPPSQKCYLLALPIELIESLCRHFIDLTTATCLGLTCHAFFNITEHIYPFSVPLHMRTKGRNRKCLGHLLTDWMAPKYSFDHSWGMFLVKREWRRDEQIVEKRWREKEGWKKIGLVKDKIGAVVAYESMTRGF